MAFSEDDFSQYNLILVVGSRRCSAYGKAITRDIVERLASRGFVIVFGLARGIATEALKAAVKVGGKTVGVLGYGHNYLKHDKEITNLVRKLVRSGNKVISPFKKSQYPTNYTFIYRNEKMVDLCDVVLVVEATLEGGSMHVAQYALEQNKPVFAVPGNLNSYTSHGTHLLIKNGAILVSSIDDINIISK